jgi:hypothetical protein
MESRLRAEQRKKPELLTRFLADESRLQIPQIEEHGIPPGSLPRGGRHFAKSKLLTFVRVKDLGQKRIEPRRLLPREHGSANFQRASEGEYAKDGGFPAPGCGALDAVEGKAGMGWSPFNGLTFDFLCHMSVPI